MFKKEISVKPSSNIKSSEKRKLQLLLESQNKGIKIPNKLSKASFNTPNIKKGTLYFDAESNDPVFFQLRDGTTIIPTLHGLWASRDLESNKVTGLPVIVTHDAVVDRLINGANLMVRGCLGPFDQGLRNGAVVAVVNYARPSIAVAVGLCMMDLEGKTNDTAPQSGVAVEIWTVVGDKLALLGRPMSTLLKENNKNSTEMNNQNNEQNNENIEVGETKNGGKIIEEGVDNNSNDFDTNNDENTEDFEHDIEVVQNVHIQKNEKEIFDEQCSTEESNIEEYVMTIEDIDEMFKRALLYTLSQENLEFPILASQFISAYILKNLPPVDSNVVNMKKTSWKKTAKFLKAMEKETLLKLKGKDDNLNVISAATRDDPRVSNFVPYRIKKSSTPSGNKVQNSNSVDDSNKLIVKTYIKPTNSARMLFNRLEEKYDAYYSEKEVKELIQRYIKQTPSIVSKSNPQMIEPDDILREFGIKKPIKRAELSQKILTKFSPYYTVYRKDDENSEDIIVRKRLTPKKGQLPAINVIVESLKVGNKVATRISGCEKYFVNIDELSNTLKVKCSGSTTITDAKDPKDGKILTIQGKHENVVLEVLHVQWGIPTSVCMIDNTTKLKGRRKR